LKRQFSKLKEELGLIRWPSPLEQKKYAQKGAKTHSSSFNGKLASLVESNEFDEEEEENAPVSQYPVRQHAKKCADLDGDWFQVPKQASPEDSGMLSASKMASSMIEHPLEESKILSNVPLANLFDDLEMMGSSIPEPYPLDPSFQLSRMNIVVPRYCGKVEKISSIDGPWNSAEHRFNSQYCAQTISDAFGQAVAANDLYYQHKGINADQVGSFNVIQPTNNAFDREALVNLRIKFLKSGVSTIAFTKCKFIKNNPNQCFSIIWKNVQGYIWETCTPIPSLSSFLMIGEKAHAITLGPHGSQLDQEQFRLAHDIMSTSILKSNL